MALSRWMSPWCQRAMLREMAMPMPEPPLSRLREGSSRTKGSKTRSRSASGMPGPWSRMKMRSWRGLSMMLISTCLP